MPYTPKPLGYKAIAALEDSMSILRDIQRASGAARRAVVDGRQLEAVMTMADMETMAMKAFTILSEARAGKYQS